MNLSAIPCSNCQAHGLEVQPNGAAACHYCGAANAVEGVICPNCDEVNAAGEVACANCRQGLTRRCPRCDHANWTGAEQCARCGRELDAVTLLSTRFGVDPANRYNQLARESAAIKAKEAEDSRRRMGKLEAIEQRRQALLAEARRRRDAQQKQLALAAAALGVVVVLAVVVAYINLSRP
jgi:hypothetical protein